MMAVLLLGVGGIGFYVCWLNASFLKTSESNSEPYLSRCTVRLVGGLEIPALLFPILNLIRRQPVMANRRIDRRGWPGVTADLRTIELPMESRDSRLASEQMKGSDSNTSNTGGRGNDEAALVATISEMTGWREKPITVQSGSTVAEIATNIYGTQRNLGLDLIKEYNTHIENLNRIIAGQRLWLPPLSRETLVRHSQMGRTG